MTDEPNDGEIKLVMAVVRPDKLGDVKQALAETGAPSLTVTNVSGRGSQPAKKGQWRGEEYVVDLHQKVKIECIVADIPAQDVVDAIAEAAHTGEPGDGVDHVLGGDVRDDALDFHLLVEVDDVLLAAPLALLGGL